MQKTAQFVKKANKLEDNIDFMEKKYMKIVQEAREKLKEIRSVIKTYNLSVLSENQVGNEFIIKFKRLKKHTENIENAEKIKQEFSSIGAKMYISKYLFEVEYKGILF